MWAQVNDRLSSPLFQIGKYIYVYTVIPKNTQTHKYHCIRQWSGVHLKKKKWHVFFTSHKNALEPLSCLWMRKSNFLFFLILRTVCSTVVALACSGNYMVYSVLNQQPISRWVTNPTNTNKHNTKDKHQITHTVSHAECLEVNQNEQRIMTRHVLLKETTVWDKSVYTEKDWDFYLHMGHILRRPLFFKTEWLF